MSARKRDPQRAHWVVVAFRRDSATGRNRRRATLAAWATRQLD